MKEIVKLGIMEIPNKGRGKVLNLLPSDVMISSPPAVRPIRTL